MRNKLKNSRNQGIVEIYNATKGKNTYDQYKYTREEINDIRNGVAIDTSTFTTQALVIKAISGYADKKRTTAWHKALSTLPTNIYSFVIRYLNNTLANNIMGKWGLKNFAKCDICDGNQTLGHVVGGCKTAIEEKWYNWRHDSILAVLLNFIKTSKNIKIHCRIEGYMNPSVIIGEENRCDMIVTQNELTIFVLELTVGFTIKVDLNTKQKANKYREMLKSLENKFEKVDFVNLSMGALGIAGIHSSLTNMLKALGFQQQEKAYLIKKIMCCCIRGTYYVFCMRNKA